MTKRIVFAPIHGPSMIEMLPIAKRVWEDKRCEPVFFLFNALSEHNFKLLQESNIRFTGPRFSKLIAIEKDDEKHESYEKTSISQANLSQGINKRIIKWVLSFFVFSFLWYLIKYWRYLRYSRIFLIEEEVAAVVVIGDRHVGWETALIKVANDLNIPTLIVPFAVSDPGSDIEARIRQPYAHNYEVSSIIEKFVVRRFPLWVKEKELNQFCFLPIGNALAAEILGMMPSNPWTIGGGNAIRMAVASPKAYQAFRLEGIPNEKMVVTGKPGDDQMFLAIQRLGEKNIRNELGVKENQALILCSVPQLAEHGLLSWTDHWHEIDYLFKVLTSLQRSTLVLSFHPQSKPEDYKPFIDKYGAVFAKRRIYELIPACDVLVSTYSSVVVQAIGCGKPAIVIDFYGLNFDYYDNEPGIFVIKDREALSPTIQRLLYNQDYYNKIAIAQLERRAEWLLLDGKCTDRVINELYQMIEN
jgi:hypothetical protein